jgi:Ca-activated chloride channel family protein
MLPVSHPLPLGALALAVLVATFAKAEDSEPRLCTEDAMIVFDASGSMSGDGWGHGSEPRIDKVRTASREILPSVTRFRRVGLITYGSGGWNQCTIRLDLKPTPNAASRIMTAIDALRPAGRTPLTEAVSQAADVLDYRHKPDLIVVLTDGEETYGGTPCDLSGKLHAEADQLTIQVIGLRVKNYSWIGDQGILDAKCLVEKNGANIFRWITGRAPGGVGKDSWLPDGDASDGAIHPTHVTSAAMVAVRRCKFCGSDRR